MLAFKDYLAAAGLSQTILPAVPTSVGILIIIQAIQYLIVSIISASFLKFLFDKGALYPPIIAKLHAHPGVN